MKNYKSINQESWNNRLETHLNSEFYDVPSFIQGRSSLNAIELALLGDINGKSILHLQCHFGQDSISLSRMGANVVGIDLSDKSIEKAKELAHKVGVSTQFICSDVYDLPNVLQQKFDYVFTSYGTIAWLPDLDRWANVIQHFLNPGGQFIFAEFHPAVWMYDDDLEKIAYYYNNEAPIIEEETGTYADKSASIKLQYVCWNHGLGEVINSLINNHLVINDLQEYCYSPYPFLHHCEEVEKGKYRIKQFGDKFPLVYSIIASKKNE